jgi:hypothetical protein
MQASLPDNESPLRTETPVFVDDSGRRLARARVAVRGVVGLIGLYVALVAIGLTGSATLPALHLADLGRLATPSASAARLGKGSKAVALPSALRDAPANAAARAAQNAAARAASHASARARVAPVGDSPGGAPTPGSTSSPTTTPTPGNSTTTSPRTTPTTATTVATSSTTRPHGPPTTTQPHGPPSTRGRSGH